jgi:hypothetical protein
MSTEKTAKGRATRPDIAKEEGTTHNKVTA